MASIKVWLPHITRLFNIYRAEKGTVYSSKHIQFWREWGASGWYSTINFHESDTVYSKTHPSFKYTLLWPVPGTYFPEHGNLLWSRRQSEKKESINWNSCCENDRFLLKFVGPRAFQFRPIYFSLTGLLWLPVSQGPFSRQFHAATSRYRIITSRGWYVQTINFFAW